MLLDTHAWTWMLTNDPKLTRAALEAAEAADAVRLSPISFFEISQKVRMGKWPEMAAFLDQLPDLAAGQGILSAPLVPEVAVLAGSMVWPHRDPFDRIIAATAVLSGAVLLSADAMFDTLENGGLQRVW
ncbi:type II toxin-antitoxin system VapC family toxin [Rhodovulum marinum]|uniref:type II toxin-antitoxin system VapC family toxin n=1 Tax=Rhodovulum marinum TaxID=320662 RepID=UPI001FB6C6A3|nr:type II toxin-antitoxin system VapC family toxin [Rhodovulum marinum]